MPIHTNDDEILKYVLFSYVLALAARRSDRITVLDYGGSLGEYYWIGKALVAGVTLKFYCKELPAIAAVGAQLSPEITWHIDDNCLAAAYDVVMFSSSLQYLPDWQAILSRAAHATNHYLLLSDIPSVQKVPTYVITHRYGGVTNLQYLFNRSEIIDSCQDAGLRLVGEFEMGPHPRVANAPEQPLSAGWLFAK